MKPWLSLAGPVARCALAAAVALGPVLPAAAQIDFSKVEITTEKLADGIYMLTGGGGNIGVAVGSDAVFVSDGQYPPLTPKIQGSIASITP